MVLFQASLQIAVYVDCINECKANRIICGRNTDRKHHSAMECYVGKTRFILCIVIYYIVIKPEKLEGLNIRSARLGLRLLNGVKEFNDTENILDSKEDYKNWVFRNPMPLVFQTEYKQQRLKRSVHKEKVPTYSVNSISPYSSIVHLGVGCVGTLISPMHVLTAAHCVHDGVKVRSGPLMKPLKIGLLRRNGRQHKIRVKKIFVSKEIQPTTESRFAYDYAVLKLVRRHRRRFLQVKAAKSSVRRLTYHVFENDRGGDSLSMYKFTYCPVINKRLSNHYKILAEHCPSSSGDSGTAVFDSSETNGDYVIGVLSAWARYRHRSGYYYATVFLRLAESDIKKINRWIQNS